MADKIFLRVGAWYKASAKLLSSDIDITGLVVDPSAAVPIAKDASTGGGGGGSQNLLEVLQEGNFADGTNIDEMGDINFNDGKSIRLIDTSTQSTYYLRVTDGELVLEGAI